MADELDEKELYLDLHAPQTSTPYIFFSGVTTTKLYTRKIVNTSKTYDDNFKCYITKKEQSPSIAKH